MKTTRNALVMTMVLLCLPLGAQAQEGSVRNPFLEDKYTLGVGMFFPKKDFEIRANGSDARLNIDFESTFNLENDETTGTLNFRWRFGEKWSFFGQYWTVGDSSTAVLEEDIAWKDIVLRAGTFASAGVDADIARVFFGRLFSTGPNHEFGAGLGFHWLEISAFVSGQILSNLGDTEVYRDSVSAGAPLPNIGAWYTYAWSPKWALTARLDWLSADFDEYSGRLTNARAALHWSAFEHVSFNASLNWFNLNVDVDAGNWRGGVESDQIGPAVAVEFVW